MAVVIVIIGLLVAGGVTGFSALLEGRRVAKTASTLYQAKQCLLKRMFYSNTYPSYTANLDCDDPAQHDLAMDVDGCLCNLRDAWGQRIMYLEGAWMDGTTQEPLAGEYVLKNDAQGQNATHPDPDSKIEDKDGKTIPGVAFVLISYGRDRIPDNQTYSTLFGGGVQVDTLTINGTVPDFSTNDYNPDGTEDQGVRDDQIVYVTGSELYSILTE